MTEYELLQKQIEAVKLELHAWRLKQISYCHLAHNSPYSFCLIKS